MSVRRARTVLAGLALVAMTAVVYIPALRADFIWDDDGFLTNNPLIKAPDGLYRFWCTTQPPDYFPLTSSTLWVEWRFWGMNATGYHAVNVLLHAISAVLIWRVLKRLKIPGAWLAGLIFGVHPVNVESVAWITERKNTLPMVFYLATILVYLRFESRGRKLWFALSLITFVLALLSKTSVVTLPFVLLIIAWWQRGRIDRRDVVRAIPFFFLAIALGLVTWWFQYNRAIGSDIVRNDSFPSRLAGAGWAVWFYLSKALVPYKLTFVYPRWQIDPSSVVSYLPGAALVGCLGLFWWYRRSWGRPALAALGYYVITLLPTLGFLNIYFMLFSLVADHWQYTSIIGVIALVIGLAAALANRRPEAFRIPATVTAVVVVGVLSILSWRQAGIYKDSEMLWQDTLRKNPSAWMAHNNLGLTLANQGRADEAFTHYNDALRLNPDYPESHNNLANLLASQGKYDEAIAHYTKALRYKPDYAHVHNNLGLVLADQDKIDEAIAHFKEALRFIPQFPEAHNNLGIVLAKQGKLDEAIRHYAEAIRLEPALPEAYNNLGLALARQGKLDEAVRYYTEAIRQKPAFLEAHYNLANALCDQNKLDEAVRSYRRAIEINPAMAEAHKNLGAVLERQGKLDQAAQEYQESLRLNPQDSGLRDQLDKLLARHNQSKPS